MFIVYRDASLTDPFCMSPPYFPIIPARAAPTPAAARPNTAGPGTEGDVSYWTWLGTLVPPVGRVSF